MSKDEKKARERVRGKPADKAGGPKPKRGLSRLPSYLRHDLGMHDWVASSVVIVVGGLAMSLVVWVLSIFWPG